MALNPLQKYGIKEVADVTFYEINQDESRGAPVLFLDTLKVSTIEQTAEQAEATGGKGDSSLIIWDYGKSINVTLEDALFSAKSMAMMFGGGIIGDLADDGAPKIVRTIEFIGPNAPTKFEVAGELRDIPIGVKYYTAAGSEVEKTGETYSFSAGLSYYATFEIPAVGNYVTISSDTFPGTYYITGDTFARDQATGKDSFFQFVIPKAKQYLAA